MKHKWWHFVYGKEYKSEVVYEDKNLRTSNVWAICKKCKEQIEKTGGCTTFTFNLKTK
jgi:hypothetical protein